MDNLQTLTEELATLSRIRALALDAANVGFWDWNMETGELWWSERMFSLYGVNPSDFTHDISFWYDQLLKEGYERTITALKKSIENKTPFFNYFKIRAGRDFEERTIFAVANIKEKKGKAYRMTGINILIPPNIEISVKEKED